MNDSAENRLYSLDIAARLLNVSIWTLRSHARRGSLKITRVGRRVLVPAIELTRVANVGLPPLSNLGRTGREHPSLQP
jgi:excisionase family DNA binding protein